MNLCVCLVVFIFVSFETVSGTKYQIVAPSLDIEPIKFAGDQTYLNTGASKKIICRGSSKTQLIEWYDPQDNLIKRRSGSRFQVQDALMASTRGSVRGLVLLLSDAKPTDSGVYSCRTGDIFKDIALCVLEPVKFLNNKTDITMDEGRSITIACKYEGEPSTVVTWLRNGDVITDDQLSSKYKVMTSYQSYWMEQLLTITSLQVEDQGEYTCQAYQESPYAETCNDTTSITFTLNVKHKPKFDIENDTLVYYYGVYNDTVSLECKADAYPNATYRWFHVEGEVFVEFPALDILISDDNTAVLNVTANSSTFGEIYVCKASNLYGDAYKKIMILELTKPTKPIDVCLLNATESEAKFKVTWDEDQMFPVDHTLLQYIENESDVKLKEFQWRRATRVMVDEGKPLLLKNLTAGTEYWVRMNFMNEAGQSGWTTPLMVQTLEEEELLSQPEKRVSQTIGTEIIFGLVITCGVILFAVACVLVMKRV